MGYFPDYELHQKCWYCGRTDCNGNHQSQEAQREWQRRQNVEHNTAQERSRACQCQFCQERRRGG